MRFVPFKRRIAAPSSGFTLIELLVAMFVLTIMVLFVSQMLFNATSVTVRDRQRLDADSQARLVFSRMAVDFDRMIKRSDVDYLFAKIDGANGNDKMFFYSEAPAFFDGGAEQVSGKNSISLVGYHVNSSYQLERLGKKLTWDGTPANGTGVGSPGGMVYLSPLADGSLDPQSTLAGNWPDTIGSASDTPPYSTGPDTGDYQELAAQVCRLEICFQLSDGSYSSVPVALANGPSIPLNNPSATRPPTATDDSTAQYVAGSRWYDTVGQRGYICVSNMNSAAVWDYLGMRDVRSIVVALAILDRTSTQILPTTSVTVNGQILKVPDLSRLVSALPNATSKDITSPGGGSSDPTIPNFATTPARLMAEAWENAIKQPDFVQKSGLPRLAAQQVRIYQRIFVLKNQP